MKTHILVDWENIVCTNMNSALSGISYLDKDDELFIFYSETCPKLKAKFLNVIKKSGCSFKLCRLQNSGKNALDFYIVTEVGRLVEQGVKEIAILSRDNGYRAVKDYLNCNLEISGVNLVLADTITNAFKGFTSKRNQERSKLILENELSVDLDVLLKEQNDRIRKEKRDRKLEQANQIISTVSSLLDDEALDTTTNTVKYVDKTDSADFFTDNVVKEEKPIDVHPTDIENDVVLHKTELDIAILDAISDTKLNMYQNEIIKFAKQDFASPNDLYKASIHEFGRRNGTDISRILRTLLFDR